VGGWEVGWWVGGGWEVGGRWRGGGWQVAGGRWQAYLLQGVDGVVGDTTDGIEGLHEGCLLGAAIEVGPWGV
jgi:hypothetical protein